MQRIQKRSPYFSIIRRPSSVSLQTSQSGLIGLSNHVSTQPFFRQLLMIELLICCPSESNSGSLPPGW
jgi:hypothetical protein